MALDFVFQFLLLSFLLLLFVAHGNGNHDKCPKSFNCRDIGRIAFPFTNAERRDCGLLVVHGCDDPNPSKRMVELEKNGKPFLQFQGVFPQQNMITAFDQDLHNRLQIQGSCEAFNNNISIPTTSPLISFNIKYNITLFRCNHSLSIRPPEGFIKHRCPHYDIYHCSKLACLNDNQKRFFSACSTVVLPKKDLADTSDLVSFLSAQMSLEFWLSDDCEKCYNNEGGLCRIDSNNNFHCDKDIFQQQPEQKSKVLELALGLGIGQGGYGSVYKGKLQDGRLVAVKVLSELKGTGEEFINEVASISRTSHVNIVSLVGFCFQGSKRALVYEFMPNGSLEKFIYEDNAKMVDRQLDCKTLYDIVIGVAKGLQYLHKGCNTRILHFDIKLHNILLDEDFCPKISDFGLAKVCPRKESIVSLLGVRGTAGYIAPEVLSRNFGGVSHKSDVYSYGMMVLEMIGGRRNINVKVECTSEIYFPHWIYKRLELNQELGLRCIKNEIDKEKIRKMTVVSLWCIQTDPLSRPSIREVVDMLEGSLEALQVPPKPFLSTPSRSPAHCSTQTSGTLEG